VRDEHPGADQLIADVSGWACIPGARGDPRSLGQDVVASVGELAQLFDGFVEVSALGGVPHRGAVQCAVEKLVRSGHWRKLSNVYKEGHRVTIRPQCLDCSHPRSLPYAIFAQTS
jgi:hypothetical protein